MLKTPRLREWRERLALSQEELASRSGSSRATIADLEAGKRGAQPRTIRRLAEALEVSPEDLYDFPKKVEAPPSLEPSFDDVLEEERRTLYLNTVLEDMRDMTRSALWMRDQQSYGETPQELTGWAWKISDLRSRVDAMQQRWEKRIFGPLAELTLPGREQRLLDQIRKELVTAEDVAMQARKHFLRVLDGLQNREDLSEKDIAEWREQLTPAQFTKHETPQGVFR